MGVLLIYGPRHGLTEAVARRIAGLLQTEVSVRPVAEFAAGAPLGDHDLIVIGTAVDRTGVPPTTLSFIDDHGHELRGAQVALFTVAAHGQSRAAQADTLQPLRDRLGGAVIATRTFGAPKREAELTAEERLVVLDVHTQAGWPGSGVDSGIDWLSVDAFALELRRFAGTLMPADRLREHLATFLSSQTVATLATASPEGEPRATPIEVRPWLTPSGLRLYFLTEGGRKLQNLARNPRVSVAMHEVHRGGRGGHQAYRGLQLTGVATVLSCGDVGYAEAEQAYPPPHRLEPGVHSDDWRAVPHDRRYIRIDVTRAELLDTHLATLGYRTRQTWPPEPIHETAPIR